MIKKILCGSLAALFTFLSVSILLSYKSELFIYNQVVKLEGPQGSCSGEQIQTEAGHRYVLSAGHCANLAQNNKIKITTESGQVFFRDIIAEDPESDLLLIEGLPDLPGLSIAKTYTRNQQIRTYTHGHGYKTYRTDGALLEERKVQIFIFVIESQEAKDKCEHSPKYKAMEIPFLGMNICMLNVEELSTTAFIVPGSSGGAVVDAFGDVVGVVSAGGEGFGFLVPVDVINEFVNKY